MRNTQMWCIKYFNGFGLAVRELTTKTFLLSLTFNIAGSRLIDLKNSFMIDHGKKKYGHTIIFYTSHTDKYEELKDSLVMFG